MRIVDRGFMSKKILFCVVLMAASCHAPAKIFGHDMPKPASIYDDNKSAVSLCKAVQTKNEKSMVSLIENGANVNAVGSNGFTPLFFAVHAESKVGVEVLLKNGADPNHKTFIESEAPIHWAAWLVNDVSFLEMMLKYRGDPNLLALDDRYATVSDLIEKSGAIGGIANSPLHYSISRHKESRSIEKMELLLKAGANIDVKNGFGDTPLMHAASLAAYDQVYFLLSRGADCNTHNARSTMFFKGGKKTDDTLADIINLDLPEVRKIVYDANEQSEWRDKSIKWLRENCPTEYKKLSISK